MPTQSKPDRALRDLRLMAEQGVAEGRKKAALEPLLERLLSQSNEGSEDQRFAHRKLAELRLVEHPWRAALHLRKVLAYEPEEASLWSLLALAHTLLGNYPSALEAHREALSREPENPSYLHNLGHLLDRALGRPEEALPLLRRSRALGGEPEDEVAASLAHCLARCGELEEAEEQARAALLLVPASESHRELLSWIRSQL